MLHRLHQHQRQQLDCSFKLELDSAGALQPGLDCPTQMNGMSNIAQNLIANVVCEINLTINAKAQRPHIAVSLANMPLRGLYNSGADVSCIDEAVFRKIPADKRQEKLFLDPKLRYNQPAVTA